MPNGLACAPRFFTKILNPVFAKLREDGLEIHPEKSVMIPTRQLVFLGFRLERKRKNC